MLFTTFASFLLPTHVLAINFDWERIQLSEAEVAAQDNRATRFASRSDPAADKECRSVPGDADWPSEEDWNAFNETLDGVLMKPKPLASVCYEGSGYDRGNCEGLRASWTGMNLHTDDPTSIMSQWASGYSCTPTSQPNSTCTQGGWPVYVVRATSVRHIQLAVNFARNKNIRLVIKNSGHDFNGKSIGGYALSIWTHNLKDLTYHANYTSPTGSYTGRAVAYSAGTQAYEGSSLMRQKSMSFIVAGGSTVGVAGGFLQGGGHSSFTSYYGLAADQVLALTAVTADGSVVEMHDGLNEDLFWAFRGGGGGTFGVITSVVVKAFPNTPLVSGSIRFSTTPPRGSDTSISTETFWAGMRAYWEYAIAICDAGGLGYNFIYPEGSANGLTFTVSISLPNKSLAQYREFVRPLLEQLNSLGISLPIPTPKRSYGHDHNPYPPGSSHASPARRALGEVTGQTLIASRFFARSNFATPTALTEAHDAIRYVVERGNYTFHGMNYAPLASLSGNPSNAVNPAFRTTVLHAQAYKGAEHWDGRAPIISREQLSAEHERLQRHMDLWRAVTPGSGSYINEGDAQDGEWKDAFYGANYARLLSVKRKFDPSGVFWAVGGVGSEEWEVRDLDGGRREGIVMQDGRLCKV